MSEEKAKLSGPDLTQGVELSTVPDGTMLLGHALGEPVLLVRRGDELFALPRSVGEDERPVRLSARPRWILSRIGASKRCATWRVSSRQSSSGSAPCTFGRSWRAALSIHAH